MIIRVPSKNRILYFLILVAIFRPAYIPYVWLNYLFRGCQVLGFLYLLFSTSFDKLKNSKIIMLFGLYYGFMIVSTAANDGNLYSLIVDIIATMSVILWIHNMSEINVASCVNQLMIVLSILIFANHISILLYPSGLYKSIDAVVSARYGWLLGHQSLFAMYAAPAICVSALFWAYHRSKCSALYSVTVVISCVVQVIKLGSANNTMCIAIISGGVLLMTIIDTKRFSFVYVYLGVGLMILVISVYQLTSFMEPFVKKFLNRSSTFTGRTFVWTKTITQISKHWIIGNGIQNENIVRSQIGAVHAHNQYLQCLYLGGVISFVIFALIIFESFAHLKEYSQEFVGRVFISSAIALMFQMIFEVYLHHTMGVLLIVLSFYFERIYGGIGRKKAEEHENY